MSSVFYFHGQLPWELKVPNFNNVTLPPNEQATAQEIDSYFRQELIYKRNERMGKRVKALLEEHPDKSFFFAFGAGWCSLIHTKYTQKKMNSELCDQCLEYQLYNMQCGLLVY